jgi:membrane protease subunit HflK
MKKLHLSIVTLVLVLLVAIGLWLASGVYTLKADGGEQAVVLRFGQYVRTDEIAGLKWHMPYPIETVEIVKADVVRTLEIGYRTDSVGGSNTEQSRFTTIPEEALMITGDENLVNTETVIQYRIKNVHDFIFNVQEPLGSVRIVSESAIRRVVAAHTLDDVLTDQKEMIQSEIREDLQSICELYGLGVDITKVALQAVYAPEEVSDAFDDVIKAREDKARFINEANKTSNEILPAAQGKAQEILNEAQSYKEKRIAEARGDVENFKQVYQRYVLGKEVTRTRLYLEVMEQVLPGAKVYVMDEGGNTLKYLQLDGTEDATGTREPTPVPPPVVALPEDVPEPAAAE